MSVNCLATRNWEGPLTLPPRQLRKADLKQLSLVSKDIRELILGALWQSVAIKPASRRNQRLQPGSHLRHVTGLHVKAEALYGEEWGCPHHHPNDPEALSGAYNSASRINAFS